MANYTPNYNLGKPEPTDPFGYNSFLPLFNDNMDKIDGIGGNQNIAENYDDTLIYAVGDYVIYNGLLYKCDTAVTTAEAFDPTKWTRVVVTDEMGGGDVVDVTVNGTSVVDPATKIAEVEVPTKVSELTNDSGFIALSDLIPENKSATEDFDTINGGLLQKCVVTLEPVQDGTGTPSPSNVRLISGHTEADVDVHGKNYLKNELVNGSIGGVTFTKNNDGTVTCSGTVANAGRTYSINQNIVLPVGTYKINGFTDSVGARVYLFDSNGTEIRRFNVTSNDVEFEITSQVAKVIINALTMTVGSDANVILYPMIRVATFSADYEQFGKTYTTPFNQTVYGGTLDVLTGVLTITHAVADLGSLTWTYHNSSQVFYSADITDESRIRAVTCDCEGFKPVTNKTAIAQMTEDGTVAFYSGDAYHRTYVKCSLYTDAITFKSAVSGIKLVYELAIPTTIHLTPQQIETYIGENHICCPLVGQSFDAVEYREVFGFDDVEMATSAKVPLKYLGSNESGNVVASRAYSKGDFFYKDEYICTALTAIANGATLTLNTNYSESTLDEVLGRFALVANIPTYTDVTLTGNPTYITTSSFNKIYYIQIGKLVVGGARIQVSVEKPAGQANYLFSGLPIPKNFIVPVLVGDGVNDTIIINNSGNLTSNNAITARYYNLSFCYIAN